MLATRTTCQLALLAFFLFGARVTNAQRARGELRIEARDPQGAPLAPVAELVSEANQFRQTFQAGADGRYVVQDLPFGVYRLSLNAEGFPAWSKCAPKCRSVSP
ncbi:MAG: hypothetical protein DMG43_12580 [Acidobacteria bacterium]|nr:MAG: hypothetical protein DMG43_12580 [Acidobacteriota bacterium]